MTSKWLLVALVLCAACGALANTPGYTLSNVQTQPWGLTGDLSLATAGPYGGDVSSLKLTVTYETETRLHVKIVDANNKRWEVPNIVQTTPPSKAPAQMDYAFKTTESPFGFQVTRVADGDVLFDTNNTPFVFEDQFLQVQTSMVVNANVYGIGERIHSFRLNSDKETCTIFAKDNGTPDDINLYGSHPFYLEKRKDRSHGVFLLNSNAMDVILAPETLTYKVVGGVLDFYFFLGPSPGDVVAQYQQVIGTPFMPPYWGLGFHQCRYGWHTIEEVEQVYANYTAAQIPLDTMWMDIDYMSEYRDFTFSEDRFPSDKVASFVNKLHSDGLHYIPIFDPCLKVDPNNGYTPYDDLVADKLYIQAADGSPLVGKVWPGEALFPDWTNNGTQAYWTKQVGDMHKVVAFDGMWIDMNEISNFCDGDCSGGTPSGQYNNPPYVPGGAPLYQKTIDMTAQHAIGREYDVHSLFGHLEGVASVAALEEVRGKRAMVISRSTFAGSGRYVGHWLGDNSADYHHLWTSIPHMLSMSLFGIPLTGPDICGFNGNTNEELCNRWTSLGAFYPFSRNHNTIGATPQEPYRWASVTKTAQVNLAARYTLLPYYYTLFHEAHVNGSTVARPLFFEFADDSACITEDRQFLIGPALKIAPVLEQGATSVTSYFPDALWYNYWTGAPLDAQYVPGYVTLDAPINFIPLHIRGGYILPTQQPALTTTAARANPFGLTVALDVHGDQQSASGNQFMDDGDSIGTYEQGVYTYVDYMAQESASAGKLANAVGHNGWAGAKAGTLGTVTVLGCGRLAGADSGSASVSSVNVNGHELPSSQYQYDASNMVLKIGGLKLSMASEWSITWSLQ